VCEPWGPPNEAAIRKVWARRKTKPRRDLYDAGPRLSACFVSGNRLVLSSIFQVCVDDRNRQVFCRP